MVPVPMCRIRLLSGFTVTVNGLQVSVNAWRSRRAADLVKLLALEPTSKLHRDRLMETLWPQLPGDAAAANLRKAVHYARRALGFADAVEAHGGSLTLWPHGELDVDVRQFEAAAAQALAAGDVEKCAAAATLYTGELLPDDRYEVWAIAPACLLRERYLAVLRGARDWNRVLELDDTDEAAHRALMQRFLAAGNRREAIRQFERLRVTLREHIGVGPDPATVAVYEKVLALEGPESVSPAARVAALLANGLVAWSRHDVAEAERLARDARELALVAHLGHELGEASTLLALVGHARGRWHDFFRAEFASSVREAADLGTAVYDGHLCFQEFYLSGPQAHAGADDFAHELMDLADQAQSPTGRSLALLLLGEWHLLSGDVAAALPLLQHAVDWAAGADFPSAHSIALERLAEALVATGNLAAARAHLDKALGIARASAIPSHLVIRVLAIQLLAADSVVDALRTVTRAERWVADMPRVCGPCAMRFRLEATRCCARAGQLPRARQHLNEAERISALWQEGPWTAALWELRAEIRRVQGETARASALFLEAAESFAQFGRPLDEVRCRTAALAT